MWKLRAAWEERYGLPSLGNPAFEDQPPEVTWTMLRLGLPDETFERLLEANAAPPPHLHPGPHRVYPHTDPDALAAEIAEVFEFRRGGPYLP